MMNNDRNNNPSSGFFGFAAIGAAIGLGAAYYLSRKDETTPEVDNRDPVCTQAAIGQNGDNEASLQDEVIHNIGKILNVRPTPKLYAREYELVDNRPNHGKGDLVFKHPKADIYYVVETKWIDYNGFGVDRNDTRSRSNTKKRKEVREQAQKYGKLWSEKYQGSRVNWYAVVNTIYNDFEIIDRGRALDGVVVIFE